ncbi:MAG: HAMP domain-containing histidine kinase [Hyphomicrobium sp.]|jgi:two-component system cell cycle sensor histidine kinase PleC|uniref:sensor histidine kinase n=1 Tax=Hyphomicrobium sp. TaxID=82 RepID=UPI0025BECAEA|nr:HAMP domain-containing sensor histidine kinase [Hyphomicrobium sp.]MBX9863538.1 HAMP domain-containing histidine kinase [Hyphomicrobium sp.]
MKRRAHTLYSADLAPSVLAALDASGPAAAWAIDVDSGRILAANSGGRASLGLPAEDGTSPVLDAATPALSQLREMAAASDDTKTATLTFWAPRGAQKVRARVQILHAGAQALAIVAASAEGGAAERAVRTQGSANLRGDDGATLKEIARRIREGGPAFSEVSDPSGAAVAMPDLVTPDLALDLATLAHELKTPLAAISAASEIIKDERFGPLGNARYAGYAADIHGSALHALRLVDRLLDRDASGEGPAAGLDFVELDMRSVLEALFSQLAPLAQDAGVALTLHAVRGLPRVIADATAVRQIVLNLFSNALRHTPRGGTIDVHARLRADNTFEIAVSDTGSGMTREKAQLLVRGAASQRPHTGSHSGPGTATGHGHGIGLPLVVSLARANGAAFTLDSTPGSGTSAAIVFSRDRVVPI